MYKVKFTPYRESLGKIMLRQTKDGKGISSDGRYQFYINENIDEPDFWVVQGKGVRTSESCKVAPENTLLLTTEPKSVLVYPQRYIKQFGTICSCQEQTKHKNLILGPAILPWFVGFKKSKENELTYSLTYDNLINSETPSKTKLISVITSNKAFTQGHLDRIEFVEKLKAHYGDKIDVFGRGYRDFDDKWDVLAPYKYHISIENSSQNYYWTEKISDCFLAETFPIYYGCTNLSQYFNKEAFQPINIHDFESTVAIIDRIIAEDTFEQKRAELKECKMKVLKEYNMFDYVAMLCDSMNPELPKKMMTINPCRSTDDKHNVYNYLIKHSLFKWKRKIKEMFKGKSPLYQK
jgi:hypothetical protein